MMALACTEKGGQLSAMEGLFELCVEPATLSVRPAAELGEQVLPQDTQIGLYAVDQTSASFQAESTCRNACYQVADGLGTITAVRPAMLENGHSYRIYAYAPHRSAEVEEKEDDVILGISHGEDILLASAATVDRVSGDNHSVTLAFTHRTAQVQFVLVPAGQLGDQYLAGATFKVSGFYEKAGLSLVNGTLSAEGQEASVSNLPETLQTDAVCIIPGEGEQTLEVTVTTDRKGPVTKSVQFRFEPGKSYQFMIKYTVALTLEITTSVVQWKVFDGGDIDLLR